MGRLYQIISMGIKCNNQVPKRKKNQKDRKGGVGPKETKVGATQSEDKVGIQGAGRSTGGIIPQ